MIKYPPGRNEGTVSILISVLRDVLEPPTASSLSESLKNAGLNNFQKNQFLPSPPFENHFFSPEVLYDCTTFFTLKIHYFQFVFSIEVTCKFLLQKCEENCKN